MTFTDWKSLSPAAAACELAQRITALPDDQRKAAIASQVGLVADLPFPSLASLASLEKLFSDSPTHAPLSGVPCFIKDLFDVAHLPTLGGSSFLNEVRPAPAREGALASTLHAAGAVIAGKSHLHEFAYGLTGENPHYGDCWHPQFPDRTSGGSSSGSAVLVAAGVVPFAIGTDTGGSIRVPSAFCGIYGLRLTPHDRFIRDAFPLAPSFDTAGWMTASAADLRALNTALLGPASIIEKPRGVVLDSLPGVAPEPEFAAALRATAGKFAPPADAPTAADLRELFAGTTAAFSILQSSEAAEIHYAWLDSYRTRYSPGVWSRLDRGRHWTNQQRASAEAKRTALCAGWAEFFRSYDFLVLPVAPFPALTRRQLTDENRGHLLALTTPASLGGRPVLTVPVPLGNGLTTGLQIIVKDSQSPVIDWALSLC